MAKRHIVQYFLEVENEYEQMVKVTAAMRKYAADGVISEEEYQNAARDVEIIKANYERLAWIMHLLNLPNKKNKEDRINEESWYAALKYASKEAVLDESRDALAHLKELVAKGEFTNNES